MGDLIAGPLQFPALLCKSIILCTFQLLHGFQRSLDTHGFNDAQQLFGYRIICREPTEVDAHSLARKETFRALIPYACRAGIRHYELRSAVAAAEQPRQQCFAAPHRSAYYTATLVRVVCHCLLDAAIG